jgi:hypothetical protein
MNRIIQGTDHLSNGDDWNDGWTDNEILNIEDDSMIVIEESLDEELLEETDDLYLEEQLSPDDLLGDQEIAVGDQEVLTLDQQAQQRAEWVRNQNPPPIHQEDFHKRETKNLPRENFQALNQVLNLRYGDEPNEEKKRALNFLRQYDGEFYCQNLLTLEQRDRFANACLSVLKRLNIKFPIIRYQADKKQKMWIDFNCPNTKSWSTAMIEQGMQYAICQYEKMAADLLQEGEEIRRLKELVINQENIINDLNNSKNQSEGLLWVIATENGKFLGHCDSEIANLLLTDMTSFFRTSKKNVDKLCFVKREEFDVMVRFASLSQAEDFIKRLAVKTKELRSKGDLPQRWIYPNNLEIYQLGVTKVTKS